MDQIIKTEKLTLSIPEAAKRLGISNPHMRCLARTAGFPAFNVGKRVLISAKGLEEWVDKMSRMGTEKGVF